MMKVHYLRGKIIACNPFRKDISALNISIIKTKVTCKNCKRAIAFGTRNLK